MLTSMPSKREIQRTLIRLSISLTKCKLPFFKRIILADNNNWIGLDYQKIAHLCFWHGYQCVFVNPANRNMDYGFKLDENYQKLIYRNVNLYSASIYNICADLQIFPDELDIQEPKHREVIKKWYNLSAEYVDYMDDLIIKWKPAKIVVSQGHVYDSAAVRYLGASRNIEVIAFENTFNKNKIVWDNISGITVNKNLAKNFYWKYNELIDVCEAKRYADEYIADIKVMKSEQHDTPSQKMDQTFSESKTILFLGQVYTDASLLFGLTCAKNPIEIIEVLTDYSIENNCRLIIKLHPKEHTGKDILDKPFNDLTFQKISNTKGLPGKIQKGDITIDYENKYDTYSLIDQADICVTINSQAGLEALVKGKNVITCGQSSYSGLGFTFDAVNKEMLVDFLNLVLREGMSLLNIDEINKLFYILNKKYFINRNEHSLVNILTAAH